MRTAQLLVDGNVSWDVSSSDSMLCKARATSVVGGSLTMSYLFAARRARGESPPAIDE
jgi:hypothetical protein